MSRLAADGIWFLGENSVGVDWAPVISGLNSSGWVVAENNPFTTDETDRVASLIGRLPDASFFYEEDGVNVLINSKISGFSSHQVNSYGTVGNTAVVLSRSYAGGADPRQALVQTALQNQKVEGVTFEINPDLINSDWQIQAGCKYAESLNKKCYLLLPPSLYGTNYLDDIQAAVRYFTPSGILDNPNTFIVPAAYARPGKVHFISTNAGDRNSIESVVSWLKNYRMAGSLPAGPLPLARAPLAPAPDGDIFLQYAFNGQRIPQVWKMSGTQIAAEYSYNPLSAGWNVDAIGDFNGDHSNDLLMHNGQQMAVWIINTTNVGGGTVSSTTPAGWSYTGVGDFNGDGTSDILLQSDRQLAVWEVNGTQVLPGSGIVSNSLLPGWTVLGAGDFDGDAKADILMQNGQQLAVWLMNGTQVMGGGNVGSPLLGGWNVIGVGDFNGDGKADILMQNGQQLAIWFINKTTVSGESGTITPSLLSGWNVVGIRDFNGDGKSDILLKNGQSLSVWEMNGLSVLPTSGVITSPLDVPGYTLIP